MLVCRFNDCLNCCREQLGGGSLASSVSFGLTNLSETFGSTVSVISGGWEKISRDGVLWVGEFLVPKLAKQLYFKWVDYVLVYQIIWLDFRNILFLNTACLLYRIRKNSQTNELHQTVIKNVSSKGYEMSKGYKVRIQIGL